MLIEGSECRCGYKTISKNPVCPSCSRSMSPRKFFDEGKVLSFISLGIRPEGHEEPMDLVMVEIDNGPQLVCWAKDDLEADQRVRVFEEGGLHRCKVP